MLHNIVYRYNIPLSNGKNYTLIEFNKVRSDHTNDQYWRFTFNNYSQICENVVRGHPFST